MKRKRSTKPKPAKCPCCKEDRNESQVSMTVGRIYDHWGTKHSYSFQNLITTRNQWACNQCLLSKKATRANPDKQVFCDQAPYLAYYDISKTCETCKEEYLFRQGEQQYWYEELQFWVQSIPINCPNCRKSKRDANSLNNELSNILADKDNLSIKDMERLAEIYTEINKPDRVKYFQRQIEKRKKQESKKTN